MSDSGIRNQSSGAVPSDGALESSLRREVVRKFKGSDSAELSVNLIRKISEQQLGLEKDFFLNDARWKSESKRIIKEEVAKQDAAPSSPIAPPRKSSPVKRSSTRPAKRSSPVAEEAPKKKRKTSIASSEELSSPPSDLSSIDEKPKSKPKKAPTRSSGKSAKSKDQVSAKDGPKGKISKPEAKKPPRESPDVDSSNDVPQRQPKKKNLSQQAPPKPADDSDSDLSSLVDDEPQPKKKPKSKEIIEKKPRKSSTTKAKADTEENPDAAEIRRLQGWLVKCGIRKLWGKELKPYETPKAKIKHLKEMLSDVGMTGRFSIEKANQVKEARELAADIEAVKEGAERWGKDGSGAESDGEARPQRRLVRGAKNYDFLSSDGEETD